MGGLIGMAAGIPFANVALTIMGSNNEAACVKLSRNHDRRAGLHAPHREQPH